MSGLYDEILIALHGVWNRRWLALAVAWGVCMIGWLVVSLIPNSYESKAKVYVQQQSILPEQIGITPVEQQQNVDRVRQTLASAANLEKVVRGTDLSQGITSDRDLAGKVAMLRTKIKVVSTQDNLFEITASSSDTGISDGANAKLAAQITQKLIDIFEEENVAGDRDETRQSLGFLDSQVAQRGKQLQAADQRRVEFEQKYLGLLPGAGSISDRMDAARTEINNIDSQLVAAQSALSAMNAQLAGTPASIAGASGGGTTALGSVMAEISAAKARGWTESHPDIIALRRQAAALKGQGGAAAVTGTPNPTYTSLKSMQAERAATVQALQIRKGQIQSDLNAMSERQVSEPGVASEQERLNREYEALKTQYDKLLADREEVRLRGDVQNETGAVKFRVIEPPSVPSTPAAPNRPLLLIAVLIVGIGAGVGTSFAMGQVQTTYPTAARLEKAAGLPVIGAITETVTAAQQLIRKQRLKLFLAGTGGLAGVCLLLVAVEFVQRGMA
ncbi:chain-length determining protein [Sphingobium sp. SCG-1]|uniref:XrtA system polysaccharide chain length determinant n=1 Tax=Sphingobium sp. SCG-1 TaxID=2072936 RepID=UPI000CD69847|nr:XrtA system polysaccharide chain length determinant [Sphingobium sp. SCG-1]AUW58488.1 chain-length determining protein [Sphingobium sp. SCG-1]